MTTTNELFEEIGNVKRYPILKLVNIGDKVRIKLIDDGKIVTAEVIGSALKEKKIKGIKPRDSLVFLCEKEGETLEFWISRTNYTNLKQLRDIRDNHNKSLIGVTIKVEKVSENDPTKSTLEITE